MSASLKAMKAMHPEITEELCQAFRTLNLGDEKAEQVDQVLSAISKMTKIDLSTLEFKDEPKMWEEAKHSADAK